MANHPSTLKRERQALKRRARYRAKNREIDALIKKVRTAGKDAGGLLPTLQSKIAKMAHKGNWHPNTASRTISRLFKLVGAQK